MSVAEHCQVCERASANHRCDRCGTAVCRMHFDAAMGLCAGCAEKAKPNDRRGDTFLF